AVIVAYAVNRKLFRGYQTLAYLSVAPTVVPAIVLAAGLLIAYSGPPFFLYGTIWILLLAYLTKELPVGYTQVDTTMKGIHIELEEASRILGAHRLSTMKNILALGQGRDRSSVVTHVYRRGTGAERFYPPLYLEIMGAFRAYHRPSEPRSHRGYFRPEHPDADLHLYYGRIYAKVCRT